MADEKKNIPTGNLRFIHLFTFVAIVVIVGLVGWVYYQRYTLDLEIDSVTQQIADTETQLAEFKEKELDTIIIAQQTADEVEASTVWSSVVTEILGLTPSNIFYSSYSASRTNEMSLSVLTDTYESAAELISIFNSENEAFSDVFVSSITHGFDSEGADVVSFGVTFNVL